MEPSSFASLPLNKSITRPRTRIPIHFQLIISTNVPAHHHTDTQSKANHRRKENISNIWTKCNNIHTVQRSLICRLSITITQTHPAHSTHLHIVISIIYTLSTLHTKPYITYAIKRWENLPDLRIYIARDKKKQLNRIARPRIQSAPKQTQHKTNKFKFIVDQFDEGYAKCSDVLALTNICIHVLQ